MANVNNELNNIEGDLMQDSWVRINSTSRSSSYSSLTSCTDVESEHFSFNSSAEGNRDQQTSDKQKCDQSSSPKHLLRSFLCKEDDLDCRLNYWASRCEAVPPKGYPVVCEGDEEDLHPLVDSCKQYPWWSLRHSKYIRNEWCSAEVVSVFLVSNMVSFFVGFYIGFSLYRKSSICSYE